MKSEKFTNPRPKPESREGNNEILTPMDERASEVTEFFAEHESSVLVAHTGAGKTTRGPEFLLKALGENARIAVTVPRVNIATSVSEYVAKRGGHTWGDEVGYQVRFDDHTREGTNLNFMTDGIILRKLMSDPLLKEFDAVMVDEAHERSLNIDLTMGLLKETQKKRRELGLSPLKIVISSATIEKEKFATYFGTEATKEIEGKMFPVEDYYLDSDPYDYMVAAAEKCKEIIESGNEGDILVFMPGRGEISKVISAVENLDINGDFTIHELHASISKEEQLRATKRGAKRRIIVATNIAEAGITVDGVRHVVDSGFIKETDYDPASGIQSLKTKKHSLAGLKQRRGRAGRLTDGEYHALYTKDDLDDRREYSEPEIKRSNLANVVLTMKKIGIDDIQGFDFIDKPDAKSIDAAIKELETLGGLDNEENLTQVGEMMAELPVEPKIARMLVEAVNHDCAGDIATVAAFMGEKSVFMRPKGKENEADTVQQRFKDEQSDYLTLLNVWNEYRHMRNGEACRWSRENFLRLQTLARVRDIRGQLLRILKQNRQYIGYSKDKDTIGKSVAAGLISNLVKCQGYFKYDFIDGSAPNYFFLHPSSSTHKTVPDLCVAGEIFETKKTWLSGVQTVKPEWIPEIAPQLVERVSENAVYNPEKDTVSLKISQRLKGTYIDLPDGVEEPDSETATNTFVKYLTENRDSIPVNEHNFSVMETYNQLCLRSGGDITENSVFDGSFSRSDLQDIYRERLSGGGNIHSVRDLENSPVDLTVNLDDFMSPDTEAEILRSNPDTIVIGDKDYDVMYTEDYYETFYAAVEIDIDDIFTIKEIPQLPSGREISVLVSDNGYRPFSQLTDLEVIKQKCKARLIEGMWSNWKSENADQYSQKIAVPSTAIELPGPITYGSDPETQADLIAYPAIDRNYDDLYIRYYPNKEDAEHIHRKAMQYIESKKEELAQKAEYERIKDEASGLIQETEVLFEPINNDYDDYGLDYSTCVDIRDQLYRAKRLLEDDATSACELINEVKPKLEAALQYKEVREKAKVMVDEAIGRHLQSVPGLDIEFDEYNQDQLTSDELELIRFPYTIDDYHSFEDIQVVATELQAIDSDGQVKTVAQIIIHPDGYVNLVRGADLTLDENNQAWSGEPFETIEFIDKGVIMNPSEVAEYQKEKQSAEQIKQWQEDREYAETQVEGGYWHRGSFTKESHPKTGADQWVINQRHGKLKIKYIVSDHSYQPTTSQELYYYSEENQIVDTPFFKLFLVDIQYPLPEEAPHSSEDLSLNQEGEPETETNSIEFLEEQYNNATDEFGRLSAKTRLVEVIEEKLAESENITEIALLKSKLKTLR